MSAEHQRLAEYNDRRADWKHWGPYLAERAWGTVREDYSADGSAWTYFPHDHARSRAYRWSEDGLLGISDREQFLCFALALWNGKDPILKERAFGLSGPEGNHGEDLKELYYFLDSTPTHSYMKALYKYPQGAFPYDDLVAENGRRSKSDPEYELLETGVFDADRYFDVFVEYAKADAEDVLVLISVVNRGPEPASLQLLPTLWFRNTWSWGRGNQKPRLSRVDDTNIRTAGHVMARAEHAKLGTRYLICQAIPDAGPDLLFTENETNGARVFPGTKNGTPYVKDGINQYVVHDEAGAVNPERTGTKAAAQYRFTLAPGQTRTVRLRLTPHAPTADPLGDDFLHILNTRRSEADAFYETVYRHDQGEDERNIQRQALAGMLWNKQFYHYDLREWLEGDPACPKPPEARWRGRNCDWKHASDDNILSVPDSWEFPWFASWDLAFHCLPLAMVDPEFAKRQLILLLREWYMHPNGQIPAYEWEFGDVNPPVHAWAALRVYRIDKKQRGGKGDVQFLKRVFQKLLINFTWWVNRKDPHGRNLFQGGFLGLDNIGLFDRSANLPNNGYLDQVDGTSWMAMYCLNMLGIALELAGLDGSYEDVATKFLEHFFHIAHAMNDRGTVQGQESADLWDEETGFYYDVLHMPDGKHFFLPVRSMVGLIPLLAVETLEPELLKKLPDFNRRLEWFLSHRPGMVDCAASVQQTGAGRRRLFSVVDPDRLRRILGRMLDEKEFLSPFGVRSLSRCHKENPVNMTIDGRIYSADYEPAESTTELFGGNSNWRGPIWFPINYLIIEALQKFDYYYGPSFTVECPTGSGRQLTLWNVAAELSKRLIRIFQRGPDGHRPIYGGLNKPQTDPHFRDFIFFHEYFHGDNGAGLGASHQTGWTGLVAKLIQQRGVRSRTERG